jgi:CBS domain-containing protein
MHEYLRRHIRRGVEPLYETDPLREAARRLSVEQLTDLPVVGPDGRIVGLFGEKELIEALAPSYLDELRDTGFVARDFEDIADEASKVIDEPLARFMCRQYATLEPDFSLLHCCELFLHNRQGVIPIVEGGRPVGLIRRSDVGRAILEGAGAKSETETIV